MTKTTIRATNALNVPAGGTYTVPYPAGKTAADFVAAGAKLTDEFGAVHAITVALGESGITITNPTGRLMMAGQFEYLDLVDDGAGVAPHRYAVSPSGDATGVTDVTEINAKISAAVAAGNAVVHFSEGQYYVSAPIRLKNATGVVLDGGSGAARIKLADDQGASVPGEMSNIIEIDGCTGCGVVGLKLDGNYQNQNMANLAMAFGRAAQGGSGDRRQPFLMRYIGAGSACSAAVSSEGFLTTTVTGGPGGENLNINLSAASYNTLSELVAYIDGLAAYSATILHSSFGLQLSSRLYAQAYADIRTANTNINFANASNAGTHEIYGNCIYLINSSECVVSGNDLSNAPHMGVLITGNSSFNRIANNTGTHNNWRACEIWPNAGTKCTGNIISGNEFADSYHDSIVAEFPGAYRNTIANNSVRLEDRAFNDGEHAGIKVYNANGNVVIGNTLSGCFLMVEVGPCDYNVIIGNTVDGRDRDGLAYVTRGVYVKAGIGNVVSENTLHDPFYDTIRVGASASKTVVAKNILTLNNNVSRYPIIVEASSAGTVLSDNILDGNTNAISDSGTRTILNGVGQNGSHDPASAGNWLNNGVEGVRVQWDNGAGKKRLSQYSGGAWINYYVEP